MASQTSIDGEHVVSLQLWRYLVLLAVAVSTYLHLSYHVHMVRKH